MVILEVYSEAQLFSYSTEVEADALERDERAGSDDIEAGSRSVTIISDTFVGKTDKETIPDVPIRARIVRDDIQIGDGIIKRSGIVRSPDTNEWSLSLEGDAKDLFTDYLKSNPIATTATPVAMDTLMIDSGGLGNVLSFDYWSLQDLWETTMDALDVQNTYQDMPGRHWFVLDVKYLDVSVETTISRQLPVYITTPDTANNRPEWSAFQLFEHLKNCLGWRIKVSFLPFPSSAYQVTILTDRWSDPPTSPVDVTPFILDRDRTHECEDPQLPDFAIQYENQVKGENIASAGSTRPSEIEIYAATNRQLDPEGASDNADLIRLDVTVPDSRDSSNVVIAAYQPDVTNHPNYAEQVTLTQPVITYRNKVYQCAIQDNASTPMMVLAREPGSAAPGQDPIVAEHYAITLAKHYEMRRSSFFVVNVRVDIDSIRDQLPQIADPVQGCLYNGEAHMVRGLLINDETGIAEYELARIAGTPELTVELPTVCPPKLMALTCVDPAPDLKVLINFQSPDAGCGDTEPVSYDIYYYKPGLTTGWEFIVNLAVGTYYYEHIRSGATAGEYIYRIESVNSLGTRSNPLYETVVC